MMTLEHSRSRELVTPTGRSASLYAIENNWYEGSRWSPDRSWVWFPLQDAKRDLGRFTRYELNKRGRYLWKNSPFIRGLIERLTVLTVGSGFYPVFKSDSKPAWAVKAQSKWKKKCRNVNLTYRQSFSGYQRALVRARYLDGEMFSIKTWSNAAMERRVQAVEGDRCVGAKGDTYQDKINKFTVDGVNLNAQGEPISYKFRGVEQPYAAEDIVHHYTAGRAEQYRGETILSAAINTATDVDDILALEKSAVKDASSHKDIIETSTGELDPEKFRTLRYGNALTGQMPTIYNLPLDTRTKDDYYRVGFGAQPVVLRTGDKYTPYKPDRPGSAWQGFMEFLSNTICLSTGLPPSVVLPVVVGGTDIRRDLDIAQRVVEPIHGDICLELEEIIMYLLEDDLQDGDLSDAPDDWYINWHTPRKLTVDRSQAQQDRQDVQAGLMTREEYHAEYGDDGDQQDQNMVNEAKTRMARILAAGFEMPDGTADVKTFVQVLSLNPQMFTTPTQAEPDDDKTDDDKPPTTKKKGANAKDN